MAWWLWDSRRGYLRRDCDTYRQSGHLDRRIVSTTPRASIARDRFVSNPKPTQKQDRQAAHIEQSYEQGSVGKKEAERRAWATVNQQFGGGAGKAAGRAERNGHG
jgi:hypothetical protein